MIRKLLLSSIILGILGPNLVQKIEAQGYERDCQILASTDHEIILFSLRDDNYIESISIDSAAYSLSQNHQFLAVENSSSSPSSKEIRIFSFSQNSLIEVATIPDMALIRGLAWTSDSEKLLLQNGYESGVVFVYDISANTLTQFPSYNIYQVAWSPNNDLIAFVAKGESVQNSDEVVTLYASNPDGSERWIVSSVGENVGWYFEKFIWLSNDMIAFTSCTDEDTSCQLNIVDVKGKSREVFEGNYFLIGQMAPTELLVVDRIAVNTTGSGTVDLQVFDTEEEKFEHLVQLPAFRPVPFFSWSPDGQKISYVNALGETVVLDGIAEYVVPASHTFDAGRWHPNSEMLLFQSDGDFYVFDVETSSTELVIDIPDGMTATSPVWVCPQ